MTELAQRYPPTKLSPTSDCYEPSPLRRACWLQSNSRWWNYPMPGTLLETGDGALKELVCGQRRRQARKLGS